MEPVAVALGAAVLGAAYLSPAALKPGAVRALARRARERRALVLTYDDGPGPGVTTALLEVFREFDAHATFFVSGRRALEHRAVVEAVLDGGHEVGSHGFGHVHAWRATPWRVARDVRAGAELVAGMRARSGGATNEALFRPPYGKSTLATVSAARRAGARVAWWTVDSGDSHDALPTALPGRERLLADGGVVLMHDLDRSAARNAYVLEVTGDLLGAASGAGLEVLTLGALWGAGR